MRGLFFLPFALACPFAEKAAPGAPCPHDLVSKLGTPSHTKKGCTCKTTCGASISDGFNCDWCYTQDGCGMASLAGTYDYCVYPPGAEEAFTWQTKQALLWGNITANQTSGTYPNVAGIVDESVQTSFDDFSDVAPDGRLKYIHSVGTICPFSFAVSSSSPFSGLFAPSTTAHGFVRIGSALPVTMSSGVVPGIGFKFLRTGLPSANFVALNSLNPLPDNSYNFFKLPLSNHIPAPDNAITNLLATKFEQASGCPTQVGLSDVCASDINGNKVASPNFPFKLSFTSKFQYADTPVSQATLQKQLASIGANEELLTVLAWTSPKDTNPITLGTIVTTEHCVNSAFGDASLFFRHQLIEEDWALRPSWVADLDPARDCGRSSINPLPPQPQCN